MSGSRDSKNRIVVPVAVEVHRQYLRRGPRVASADGPGEARRKGAVAIACHCVERESRSVVCRHDVGLEVAIEVRNREREAWAKE